MLEFKVTTKGTAREIKSNVNADPVMFNSEFTSILDAIVKKNGKDLIAPSLFMFIEKNFTEEEIKDGLERATWSRKMAETLVGFLPKKHEKSQPKPQNLQKNNKNTEQNNQKDKVKPKKPRVKVTEFDSFDDFIADLEKSFRGE